MKRFAGKLTYANVVATFAAFLALSGGTVYAATHVLPKDSVGAAQLKKGAVTRAKLSEAALAALAGPAGPQGAPGKEGPRGPEGAPGRNLTAETPLASGATETGIFITAGGSEKGDLLTATVSFVQPLPVSLDADHAVIVRSGEASAEGCPGRGRAEPGFFCVYVKGETEAAPVSPPFDPSHDRFGVGVDGAALLFVVKETSEAPLADGTWAVTAP